MTVSHRCIYLWLAFVECALLVLTARQIGQVKVSADPDPDGYVSYVQEWRRNGVPPVAHRRLPGYPAFLNVSDSLIRRGLLPSTRTLQSVIGLVAIAGFAFCVGRRFGRLVRIILLGLFAAPNLFVGSVPVVLPDSLYTIIFVPFVIFLFQWGLKPGSWRSKTAGYCLLAVGIAILHLLRPSTAVLLCIFCASAVAAAVICRRLGRLNHPPAAGLALNFGSVIVCCLSVQMAANRIFDQCGAQRRHYSLFLENKIVAYTPAASASEADGRLEEQKRELASAGTFTEREYFTYKAQFDPADLDQVAMKRLLHHPASFLGNAIGNDLRWNYHLTIGNFTPFASLGEGISRSYPPEVDTWQSRLFRTSGLDIFLYSPTLERWLKSLHAWKKQKRRSIIASRLAVGVSVAHIALVGWLLILGGRYLFERFPVPTLALAIALPVYYCFVSIVVIVDQRYFLPFSPFIYMAFAIALTNLAGQWSRNLTMRMPPHSREASV